MFLKLVGAVAGNHNFTPLSNQRNEFAEGTFCGAVYFIQQPRAFVLCRYKCGLAIIVTHGLLLLLVD